MSLISKKIVERNRLIEIISKEKNKGKKIVFTNGCFDILHRGHVEYLEYASTLGDILVIGVNSDESVRRLKGKERPINTLVDRMYVLAALYMTDFVTSFHEDTPYNLIKEIMPHILVKAGDYTPEEVVGKDIVEKNGGKVVIAPYIKGYSTTNIINKMKKGE